MKWFDNPRKRRRSPSKRRKSKRRPPKGFRSWKAYMASIRPKGKHMARRKRSRGRKRTHRRRSSRRARAVVTVRSNRRRVRRYRRRRNPGARRFTARGLMNRVMQGATDGLWIVGGKAVTNALPQMFGLSPTGALGLGVKALSAVGAGYVFGMVSANAGKLATAAGFAAILEPFIRGLNIPIISSALADDEYYEAYPEYGAYPDETAALPSGYSAYPEGVGEEDYAMQY